MQINEIENLSFDELKRDRAALIEAVRHGAVVLAGPPRQNFREAYLTAVEREGAEEVSVEAGHTDQVVALLNDDSTEVGQVHLGIVHYWTLVSPQVSKREQMITQMAFMTPAELQAVRDSLETWSRLCLDHLDEMTTRGQSGMHSRPVRELLGD